MLNISLLIGRHGFSLSRIRAPIFKSSVCVLSFDSAFTSSTEMRLQNCGVSADVGSGEEGGVVVGVGVVLACLAFISSKELLSVEAATSLEEVMNNY